MGTRADFYVGRGATAEWLGSIAWDGYPSGLTDTPVLGATSEEDFRVIVRDFLATRRDGTTPEMGWPWPWENSQTTDYAYALDEGKVWASCFGHAWFDPMLPEKDDEEESVPGATYDPVPKVAVFPNMKKCADPFHSRSGIMVFRGN
jgi:hypothetical protein